MTEPRLQALYQRALATRDGGARERCPTPEAMLALVRGEGAEVDRLETLDHVMACDACRREYELLRAIEVAGAEEAAGAETAPFSPRVVPIGERRAARVPWRRFVPLALAASVLIAVGVGVRQRFGGPEGPDVARGGADALALVAPAGIDVDTRAPLTFVWRRDPAARRYVLELLDDAGRAVISQGTADTTVTLRDPATLSKLAPGAEYRWWVRSFGEGDAQRASAVRRLRVRVR